MMILLAALNTPTILVLVAVGVALIAAVTSIVLSRKNSKGCGGNCSCCSGCNIDKNKKDK